MSDYVLDPPAIDGTPAQAFASHATRMRAICKQYAQDNPLSTAPAAADEDNTMHLVAHLQAALDDPDFAVPEQEPSKTLAPKVLRSLNKGHGSVGTSDEDHGLLGDYDMALKGLMVIAYRYRRLLSDGDMGFILDELVPSYLTGAHDPGVETKSITVAIVVPVTFPETENHLLMIESTRYLANQLLLDRTGNKKYDNVENGLTKWLLGFMHTIAQHDFLEFNARPYQRLALHALLNLHEFARDEPIRTAAQILLDYVTVKFAVSSDRRRRVCPFRRLKEHTNRLDQLNDLIKYSPPAESGDPLTGFFLAYAGPTDPEGNPLNLFPKCWGMEALIAGLAAYRPPPAAYILAMRRDNPPFQHRFYHGTRPELASAGERGEAGVEVYYKSPSFLLTGGGMFLTSGYGHDEFTKYKQTAIAQATTLIPTRADVKFGDLIRFQSYPDERDAVNTGVHLGFACGANLRPADKGTLGDTSKEAPALASHAGFDRESLCLAWTGRGDGNLNCGEVFVTDALGIDGVEGFTEKVALGDTAERAPALASHDGRLFLAFKGNGNDNLNLMFSENNGATFRGKITFGDTSDYSPALASHGGRLFLAWTGRGDGNVNVAQVTLIGSTAGGFGIEGLGARVALGDTAEQAPAIVSHGGRLFLAFKGNGNDNLNLMFSENNGATFRGKITFGDTSNYSPALASHGGRLFLAWTGRGDGNVNVAQVTLIGSTAGGFGIEGLGARVALGDTAEQAPALASHHGQLIVAWKGNGNDNLNVASSRDGAFRKTGPWQFIDLSRLGFYVALYRTPPAQPDQLTSPLESLGFLYAMEAGTMGFETFQSRTLERNPSLPGKLSYGGNYTFNTADDHRFIFWLHPSQAKYTVRVLRADDTNPAEDFTSLPLVQGPYLSAPAGHDGLIEIRHPGCENIPIVLDFRDPEHPSRQDNIKACPGPWLDRAAALLEVSRNLRKLGKALEAQAALNEGVATYRTLAEAGVGTAGAFPITFDVTRLFCRFFIIPGVTPDWVDSSKPQTLWIAPGQHQFQIAADALADFVFTITPDGAVDYDGACDGFLSGRGTPSLRLDGFEVTLDASALTGAAHDGGILLLMLLTNDDWIQRRTIRLLPGAGYRVQQGSGEISKLAFVLGRDGMFSYAPELDVSNRGPLQGAGSKTLVFKGHAVRVDSSRVSNTLLLMPVWGLDRDPSTNGKMEAVVLPSDGFQLELDIGVTDLGFVMDVSGNVTLKPGMEGRLEVVPGGAGTPPTVRVLSR